MTDSTSTPAPSQNLAMLMLGLGALLLLAGGCALLGFLLVPIGRAATALGTNTTLLSVGAVALLYGGMLFWVGREFRWGRSKVPFALPSPLLLLGAFVVVLVIGQGVLALNSVLALNNVPALNVLPAYLFPLWHVLGSLLVPLAILSFAAQRLPRVALDTMLAQFTWGGLVTITLALVFELVIGLLLLVIGILGVVALLGLERTQELATALQDAAQNQEQIVRLLTGQPLIFGIVAVLLVILFVILVPLLEELLKATGPAILIGRRVRAETAPLPAQVVLWGLAAGAGYAFTENMFNGQGGLSGGEGGNSFWVTAMILRSGTSLMHMIATGTVAVAWYQLLVQKQRARFIGLLAAAVTVHAVWNSGAVLLGGVAVLNSTSRILGGLLGGCALLFLALLFVGCLVWLRRLIRWAQPPPVEIKPSSGTLLEIKG